ncbi:hypothetical protein LJC60_02085 [Ruminococcaceae bacterium OttesenSCG-928-D13]|nr:hypothetical protein [Ruminococcaceae bacterium OttesenSCG-928-D13]
MLENEQANSVTIAQESYFAHVNWAKLKPSVDRVMLMNLLDWVIEGYLRNTPSGRSTQDNISEGLLYLNMVREIVYRDEYLL